MATASTLKMAMRRTTSSTPTSASPYRHPASCYTCANSLFLTSSFRQAKPAMQNAFWNPNNVPSITESDQSTPSIFWITNAYNTFTNNAAVGA